VSSYESKIEVTLKVVIDTETEFYPRSNRDKLRAVITDVLADQIAQYNDEDLDAAITGWKILKTKRESV
jgi:hypothetical protein